VVQHPHPRLRRCHAVQPHRVHAPVDLGQDADLPRVIGTLPPSCKSRVRAMVRSGDGQGSGWNYLGC
jgi:hypothetical protein